MTTHREMYPEQYQHALVGQHVTVDLHGHIHARGIVERVLRTQFGMLAIVQHDQPGRAWAIKDCVPDD